jgi:adhesin transport system outer membrane protein
MATYAQIFGHPAKVSQMQEPAAPMALLASSMEEAVETAQKNNPAIETARRTIELQSEKKRAAESGYMPNVDLVGKADYMHYKNTESADRKDWSMLLTISWDLFNGWKTRSQVAQASYDHGAAMDNHLLAIRQTDELVRSKWEKLITAQERMSLLENAANLAEEVLTATNKLHAAGKENIFNVLDAQNRLNDARINYAQAYYDLLTASFEVLSAMGQLEFEAITHSQTMPGAGAKVPDFLTDKP